jgi:hypothetical protein
MAGTNFTSCSGPPRPRWSRCCSSRSRGAGFLSRESAAATRTFMSPVIFRYASVLFLSLIALIPTHTAISLAAAIGGVAAVGLIYSLIILVCVIRDPMGDADALAYGACPLAAYAAALAAALPKTVP